MSRSETPSLLAHLVEVRSANVLFEFGNYFVSVQIGSTVRAVISVASLNVSDGAAGDLGGMARQWGETFRRLDVRDHLIFIQDRTNSWFTDRRGWDELIDFLRAYIAAGGLTETVAIGLSMGATGALLLDAELAFDRVIALAPQALVGVPNAPWDMRYAAIWSRLPDTGVPSPAERLRADGDYVVAIAIDVAEDVRHAAELMAHSPKVRVFASRCGEHNLLIDLKRQGVQDAFVAELLRPGAAVDLSRFGFEEVPRSFLQALSALFVPRLAAGATDAAAVLAADHPSLLPTYLYPALHEHRRATAFATGSLSDADAVMYPIHSAHVCRPGELSRYAVFGWSAFDHGFTWSEGLHHLIRFHVLDFALFPDVVATLFFLPFVNARHPVQSVEMTCNGRSVFAGSVAVDTPDAIEFRVRLQLREPDCEIRIATPDYISPDRLGLSDDVRRIALSFNHMILERRTRAATREIWSGSSCRTPGET